MPPIPILAENLEPFVFELIRIKTPQLIGIVCGCIVFTITILVVIYLLYRSGSISKLLQEMKAGPLDFQSIASAFAPQSNSLPMLYDHLIEASRQLPIKPAVPILYGKKISVSVITDANVSQLLPVCNGKAIYGESDYDPARIWGWLEIALILQKTYPSAVSTAESLHSRDCLGWPSDSEETFRATFVSSTPENVLHLVIKDDVIEKCIGMISLYDNQPRNLSIRIANVWLTPAYQGKKVAHEAIFLLLRWLFQTGYRRVTVEVDSRHIIMRKFLARCGFLMEGILRKHKIVQNRNRDTAVYAILNSEWHEIEIQMKKYLSYGRENVHKIAEVETSSLLNPKTKLKAPLIGASDVPNKALKKKKRNKKA